MMLQSLHISISGKKCTKKWVILVIPLLLAGIVSFGSPEGTRQLEPADAPAHSFCRISLTDNEDGDRIPFALINCSEEYTLNITVRDFTRETIYLGFGIVTDYIDETTPYNDVKYQVRDPLGNIIPGFSLRSMPADPSDAGFIVTREQAYAGPNINNTNTDGYNPLILKPSRNGDYVIEFEIPELSETEARVFKYFDVTVADGNTPLPGRLWSKAWQLSSASVDADENASFSLFYIYSNDSIVTRFDCNGLAGGIWSIYSNEWGSVTSGNWNERRKSVEGNATVMPEYKIFLNDPDQSLFPTGTIGELLDFQIISSECDTAVSFAVLVSKPGNIEILLDLEPLNPGTIGSEDVQLGYPVSSGYNQLTPPWNGKNRHGIPVLNGSSAEARIRFLNGLTNIPLFDVEDNPLGFKVDMQRPMPVNNTVKLKIYWDDTLLPPGTLPTSNATEGCIYTGLPPITGCHHWSINDGLGNLNTINSWWYYSSSDLLTIPMTLILGPSSGKITGPSGVCSGQSGIFRTERIAFAQSYSWKVEGPGVNAEFEMNDPDTSLAFQFAPTMSTGNYTISVKGKNASCGSGPEVSFNCYVFMNTVPPVSGPAELCMNVPAQFLLPGSYSSINWQSGKGTNTTPQGSNPVSIQWLSSGPDTIIVTALSPECGLFISSFPVNILPAAIASFSTSGENTGCRNFELRFEDQSILEEGVIVQRLWDWGDGSSTTGNITSTSHTYSSTGNKKVNLTLITGEGCVSSHNQMIRIIEPPAAEFNWYRNCMHDSLQLIDLSTGIDLNSWNWQIGTNNASTYQLDQRTPVALVHTEGPVPVRLITGNRYGCSDTLTQWIRFHGSPNASFTNGLLCEGTAVAFTDNSRIADTTLTSYQWKFFSQAGDKQIVDDPAPFITFPESSVYRLEYQVTDNFGCRDMLIAQIPVNPAPVSKFNLSANPGGTHGHITFENLSAGAITYLWDFGNGESSTLLNPETDYYHENNYQVCLWVSNDFGCSDTSCLTYYHLPGLYFPNAFSPDFDGNNDVFRPVTYRTFLDPYLLIIYNAWGQIIFRSDDPQQGWDGRFKGEDCPAGQYRFIVQYRRNGDASSGLLKEQGSVTLIR